MPVQLKTPIGEERRHTKEWWKSEHSRHDVSGKIHVLNVCLYAKGGDQRNKSSPVSDTTPKNPKLTIVTSGARLVLFTCVGRV